jgi:serine/threonine protein kinase
MVAIKIIEKNKLDGKMTKMVLREITVMDACTHPHLVRLYEVVETNNKIHLMMQLAPGRELFTKLFDQGKAYQSDAVCSYSIAYRQVSRAKSCQDICADSQCYQLHA